MRATVLNREFQHPADGWYQIETPGEHPNRAAGVVQVIDNCAVESLVNTFNREAADYQQNHGVDFPGMLIDHEHFKHDSDKETRAYGWLMQLKNRNGIPFGKISWTATGKAATDGGDYRFFSTEYDPQDLQDINRNQTPPRVRPMRLAGLTLTNDPNNKGGAPITNRSSSPHDDNSLSAEQAGAQVLAAANRYKDQTGCAFTDAWNHVRNSQPALFNRMCQSPASRRQPVRPSVIAVAANNAQLAMVQEEQRVSGGTFQRAWDIITNRVEDPNASAQAFEKARQMEPALIAKLSAEPTTDRGVRKFSRVPNSHSVIRDEFMLVINTLMDKDGLTMQQAFNRVRIEEPVFWTKFILGFGDLK